MVYFTTLSMALRTSSAYGFWRSLKKLFQFDGLLSPDQIHVLVGAIIFLSFFLVIRVKRNGHAIGLSFLIVFLVQTLNEILDVSFALYLKKPVDWRGVSNDFFNTLIVPSFCILIYFSLCAFKKLR